MKMWKVCAVRCDVSESEYAEKCAREWVSVRTSRSNCHSSIGVKNVATLTDWSFTIKSLCARFSVARAALLGTCVAWSDEVDHGDYRHECDEEE